MSIQTDVVIVGAGPCGLFQVFELGLLGIKAHVVDSLREIGGQCTALYPDKPIYDIPALPVCGAQELVDRLEEQIKPFDATMHLGEEVTKLEKNEDGDFFTLTTSQSTVFETKTVIIAGGLGSFQPRPLRLEGIDAFKGKNLNYKVTDKSQFAGKDVVILGGGDSALDWTLELYESARSMTLIHRRDEFRGAPASVEKMKALCESDSSKMRCVIGRVKEFASEGERLTAVSAEDADGEMHRVALEELLVFFGLSPNLGPIGKWGLDVNRRQIEVDTEKFQTNTPGVFAIGDINTYPGKKKLILSGFHEAALAAFAVQKHINPEAKQFLQYTTTSPIMHERLKVSGDL